MTTRAKKPAAAAPAKPDAKVEVNASSDVEFAAALGAALAGLPQNDTAAADAASDQENPATTEVGDGSGDPATVVDQGDGSGAGDEMPETPETPSVDAEAQAYADALAKLVAGVGTDDETSGGEVAEAAALLPETTGVVREWGGDRRYLVLFDQVAHIHEGMYQTADQGDELRMTGKAADRLLELGAVRELD